MCKATFSRGSHAPDHVHRLRAAHPDAACRRAGAQFCDPRDRNRVQDFGSSSCQGRARPRRRRFHHDAARRRRRVCTGAAAAIDHAGRGRANAGRRTGAGRMFPRGRRRLRANAALPVENEARRRARSLPARARCDHARRMRLLGASKRKVNKRKVNKGKVNKRKSTKAKLTAGAA